MRAPFPGGEGTQANLQRGRRGCWKGLILAGSLQGFPRTTKPKAPCSALRCRPWVSARRPQALVLMPLMHGKGRVMAGDLLSCWSPEGLPRNYIPAVPIVTWGPAWPLDMCFLYSSSKLKYSRAPGPLEPLCTRKDLTQCISWILWVSSKEECNFVL